MRICAHLIIHLFDDFELGWTLESDFFPIEVVGKRKSLVAQQCIKRQIFDRDALDVGDEVEMSHNLESVRCCSQLFAVVRGCSKKGYIVDEIFALNNVFSVSLIREEIDALLLMRLSHAIPLHAYGLGIVNVDAMRLTPGTESGHLGAGGVTEVSKVLPHIDAEEVIKALAECLLAIGCQKVVGLRAFVFA